MRYIFPFNASATNGILLAAITMSYICLPVVALIATNVICTYIPSVTTYYREYISSAAFLFVGIYSVIGIITMYVSFFRMRRKYKK